MEIILNDTGKRFNREWIFRHFTYTFSSGRRYAITGPNGSGKSTLLQVISGALSHTEGHLIVKENALDLPAEALYRQVALAAPYLELIEEMTDAEVLTFHAQFKPLSIPITDILQIIGLEKSANKQVRYFSSGMKQRLKLAQAFFSQTPVLLLDEPTTNLDEEGINLYRQLVSKYAENRLLIISSNDKQEYELCPELISMGDYK